MKWHKIENFRETIWSTYIAKKRVDVILTRHGKWSVSAPWFLSNKEIPFDDQHLKGKTTEYILPFVQKFAIRKCVDVIENIALKLALAEEEIFYVGRIKNKSHEEQ